MSLEDRATNRISRHFHYLRRIPEPPRVGVRLHKRSLLLGWAWVVVALMVVTARDARAQLSAPRKILGRVADTANAPLRGAEVTLDFAASNRSVMVTTDSGGLFHIDSPGGSGEYVLTVVAHGYRPIRRRIVNEDGGSVLQANVTLRKALSTLTGIAVVAERPIPAKPFAYEIGVGGTEAVAAGTRAASGPALSEFADALRTNLFVDPQGFLALPAAESQTQLNGLLFRGTGMPRSSPVSIKAGVGEYDIAAGGFSGGRIEVDLLPAGEFARREGELVLDAASSALGTQPIGHRGVGGATSIVDVGGTSRLGQRSAGVAWGLRASHSSAQTSSLATADSSELERLGIPYRTSAAIMDIARANGLWSAPNAVGLSSTNSATGTLRFDPSISRRETNAIVLAGSFREATPTISDPLAAPSRASGSGLGELAVQHLFRRIDGSGAAWDIRSGISGSRRSNGELSIPAPATVLVRAREGASDVGGGTVSVTLGGPVPASETHRITTEIVAQREHFLGFDERGQRKFLLAARSDWYAASRASSASIAVPSVRALQALDSGQASLLGSARGNAVAQRLTGGASQSARLGPSVRVTAGARADYQRVGAMEDGMHAHSFDVSPRIGLTWNFVTPTEGPGFMQSNLQTRQLVPPGVLRVGAGMFTADYAPEHAALPGGFPTRSSELTCTIANDAIDGATADSAAFTVEGLRSTCSDPQASGDRRVLEATASLGPRHRPSRSTRATASFLTRVGSLDLSADGIVAINDRESGVEDVAVPVIPVALFTPDANRPFFADVSSISIADGRLIKGRVRDGSLVGSALRLTSDRRSLLRRLALQVSTRNGGTRYPFRIGYVLSKTDTEEGGWDRDTFGSPWTLARAPSRFDARHQLQFEIAHSIYGVSFSFWLRAASGLPFSILVDGDVNGDGNATNDRASIPAIPVAPTTQVERAMRAVIDGAPRYASDCLLAHAGQDAGRGSCRGPWSVRTAVYASFDPGVYFRRKLADVTIVVENPLSLLGRQLGVAWMRSVSSQSQVDPVLLRVVRFDPQASAFIYDVNSHFGRRFQSLGIHGGAYRVSLSVRVPLSPGIQRQQLDRWLARNGIGQGVDADTLAARFGRNVPNLYDMILDGDDELGLNDDQRALIGARRFALARSLATIWKALGMDLVESGARQGSQQTLARVQRATDEAWEASRLSAHALTGILSPVQQSLLPSPASSLIRATEPVKFKIIYY